MLKGELTSPYEFRIITKNKEILWIMETVTTVTLKGKPAILGNSIDITRRKLAEQRLMESENIYRTIIETTGAAIAIIENDKTISMVNSAWEKLTGYSKADWEGKKKWTELADKRDLPRMNEYHRLRRIDPISVPKSYEYHLIDSQGRVKNVLSTADVIPGTRRHVSSFTDITELKNKEKELIIKSRKLEQLNVALTVLLKRREDDREELEKTLLSNMNDLVFPYIEKLQKSDMDESNSMYLGLVESNLKNIFSPFSRKLSAKYMNLTSKEIEVASFIKNGKSSKEIANHLNVSRICVDVHRYHIRSKLGLTNKKVNLRAYLSTLA
jgi:PAS domain S-box-containing protein